MQMGIVVADQGVGQEQWKGLPDPIRKLREARHMDMQRRMEEQDRQLQQEQSDEASRRFMEGQGGAIGTCAMPRASPGQAGPPYHHMIKLARGDGT